MRISYAIHIRACMNAIVSVNGILPRIIDCFYKRGYRNQGIALRTFATVAPFIVASPRITAAIARIVYKSHTATEIIPSSNEIQPKSKVFEDPAMFIHVY